MDWMCRIKEKYTSDCVIPVVETDSCPWEISFCQSEDLLQQQWPNNFLWSDWIILNLNHLEQSMWEDMSKIVFWPAERLSMTIGRILYSSVSADVNSLPFNLWTAWSLPDLVSIWILYQRDLQNLRTGKEFISDNTGVFARYNCCIML